MTTCRIRKGLAGDASPGPARSAITMANPKPALARLLARFPRIRVLFSGLVGLLLRPSLLPFVKRLFGLNLAGQVSCAESGAEMILISLSLPTQ